MPKTNAAVLATNLDLELPDEDEEYLDEDYGLEDEDLEDEEFGYEDDDDEDLEPQSRQLRRSSENDMAAQLATVTAERDGLTKRLGDVVRKSGERTKEYRDEIEAWAENLQDYFKGEVATARTEAYNEGVRSVETRLLPLLAPEEKSEYLEDVRTSPQSVSPREVKQLNFKTSNTDTPVSAVVDQFQNLGVPLDQLDRTSVETVVESGTKYLTGKLSSLDEKVQTLETKVERRVRDESGATKVSGGGGGSAPMPARSLQRQLDELDSRIDKARKRHDINGYAALKQQRLEVEAQIQRATRSRR